MIKDVSSCLCTTNVANKSSQARQLTRGSLFPEPGTPFSGSDDRVRQPSHVPRWSSVSLFPHLLLHTARAADCL